MRQYEQLLNIFSFVFCSIVPEGITAHIITANSVISHQRTDYEQGTGIHAGNRIINHDDFIFAGICF